MSIRSPLGGFSLAETAIALGIAAVSLTTIVGLLPIGLQTNRSATIEMASLRIMAEVIADLRATPVTHPRGGASTSSQYGIRIPENPVEAPITTTLFLDADGQSSPSLNSPSLYRLVATFYPNGSGSRSATLIDLRITSPPANLTSHSVSFETIVSLDRN